VSGGNPLILTFAWLAAQINALPSQNGPRLVGIDGPAGSGKSTFAAHLSAALAHAPVVSMDDFLAWDDLTSYWPRLEKQLLEPLAAGQPARYQARNWVNGPLGRTLGEWKDVPCSPTLILEGVGSCRRQVASRLSCAIWVDAPVRIRLARGILRDGEAMRPYWLRWQKMETAFFANDQTRSRADLVVDGSSSIFEANLSFKLLAVNHLRQPWSNR
jgi:uridine kinase